MGQSEDPTESLSHAPGAHRRDLRLIFQPPDVPRLKTRPNLVPCPKPPGPASPGISPGNSCGLPRLLALPLRTTPIGPSAPLTRYCTYSHGSLVLLPCSSGHLSTCPLFHHLLSTSPSRHRSISLLTVSIYVPSSLHQLCPSLLPPSPHCLPLLQSLPARAPALREFDPRSCSCALMQSTPYQSSSTEYHPTISSFMPAQAIGCVLPSQSLLSQAHSDGRPTDPRANPQLSRDQGYHVR